MTLVRIRDGEFDEEKCQHREHYGLHDADKHLKSNKRHWKQIRNKVPCHQGSYFTGKYVSEKTERERNDAA